MSGLIIATIVAGCLFEAIGITLLVFLFRDDLREQQERDLALQEQQVLQLAAQLSQELTDRGLDARRQLLRAAAAAAREANGRQSRS